MSSKNLKRKATLFQLPTAMKRIKTEIVRRQELSDFRIQVSLSHQQINPQLIQNGNSHSEKRDSGCFGMQNGPAGLADRTLESERTSRNCRSFDLLSGKFKWTVFK
ncbi:hypothetical protein CEXT_352481 [Caerostris extrusa]|uniref:Uncharacterized protein n=1 Tax=Caerostris extrusa TaxID=172846 RepID=A0AAV4XE90_CAEEX|nr:hypothetical protein CEXT_352481 [Caerostris extrusa]